MSQPEELPRYVVGRHQDKTVIAIGRMPETRPRKSTRRHFLKNTALGLGATATIFSGADALLFNSAFLKRGLRELFRWSQLGQPLPSIADQSATIEDNNDTDLIDSMELAVGEQDLILRADETAKDQMKLSSLRHNQLLVENSQTVISRLTNRQLAEVASRGISREKQLPLPKPAIVTYWTGSNCILTTPQWLWNYTLAAYEITGVNPYLLVALGHSESNSFNANAVSPVGAGGLFQFMPGTWTTYVADLPRENPLASTVAAGVMIKSIGLSGFFDQALIAQANGNSTVYRQMEQAFVNRFIGKTGRCWNMHLPQARYVFRAGMQLVADNTSGIVVQK